MTDYERLSDFRNLYAAHKLARRSKQHKRDVVAFEMDLAKNLWEIKNRLDSRTYEVGGYYKFIIHDPKTREIQALHYGDRIVQHSLCDNVLTPFFEKRLIYDNCACRKGKGTHFGINRLTGFLRGYYRKHGADGWILKLDIRKYFPSIDHAVLLSRLQRVILDPDIMALIGKIIESYNSDTGKGLPMGNQTSQIFALYYLDPVDRLVKEKLRVKYYTRYMDDMILVHESKEYLQECLRQIQKLCREQLKLETNDKTSIFPIRNGVDYLGWHFYLTETGKVVRKLRQNRKKRLKRRMRVMQRDYADGSIEFDDIKRSMAAIHGHLIHGHTYHLRKKILEGTVFSKTRNGGIEK